MMRQKILWWLLSAAVTRTAQSACTVGNNGFADYGGYCYGSRGDDGPMAASRLRFDPADGTGFEDLSGWWFPDSSVGLLTYADGCTTDGQDYTIPELYQGTYMFKHESLDYWMYEMFEPDRPGCESSTWESADKTDCWMIRITARTNAFCDNDDWILEARDLTGTESTSIAIVGDSWDEAGIMQYWRTPGGTAVALDFYCDNGPGSPSGSSCNTLSPTTNPTKYPVVATHRPTEVPSGFPTKNPTMATDRPTKFTTASPTRSPTIAPTVAPTKPPTAPPTASPTESTPSPTKSATDDPTMSPTLSTASPTHNPIRSPTLHPTFPTEEPSNFPTGSPTPNPTMATDRPTEIPTASPTRAPTRAPTVAPTKPPTAPPTALPTESTPSPTKSATDNPTMSPTLGTASPTNNPITSPTLNPTVESESPTKVATILPTPHPSMNTPSPLVLATTLSPPTVSPSKSATLIPTESPSTDECDGRGDLWELSAIQRGLGENALEIYLSIFDLFGTPNGNPMEIYREINLRSGLHDCFTFWEGGESKLFFSKEEPSLRAAYTLDGDSLTEAALICAELFTYQMAVSDVFDFSEDISERVHQQGLMRQTPIEDGVDYGESAPGMESCVELNEGSRDGIEACMDVLLELSCWSPLYVASKLVWLAKERVSEDALGWNALGLKSTDGLDCTSDCQFYSDVIDYHPVNTHDSLRGQSKFRVNTDGSFQLNLNANERRWAPLLESNQAGLFFESQHSVPHIGFTAQTLGVSLSYRDAGNKCSQASLKPFGSSVKMCAKLDDPKYDYSNEAMQVIERVNDIVDDDYLMAEIDFFDVSSSVSESIAAALLKAGMEIRYIAFWLALEASAKNDALILSVREKVLFDLVRPITVIRALDDEFITAAKWSRSAERGEITEIRARDWQSYQRNKPSSEYPSSTACICKAMEDVTKSLLEDTEDLFTDGFSDVVIDLEQAPRKGRHIGSRLWYPNLRALARGCSQSRLNAGIHFSQSVSASEELCDEVGQLTYQQYRDVILSLFN